MFCHDTKMCVAQFFLFLTTVPPPAYKNAIRVMTKKLHLIKFFEEIYFLFLSTVKMQNSCHTFFTCFVFQIVQILSKRRMLKGPLFNPRFSWYYNAIVRPMLTFSVRSSKIRDLQHWGRKICLKNKLH